MTNSPGNIYRRLAMVAVVIGSVGAASISASGALEAGRQVQGSSTQTASGFLPAADLQIAAGSAQGFAVVELFTSEGCSSCPPADDVLAEVVDRVRADDLPVYPIAWHVDYWDYLGWPDPYGMSAASSRQRQYARDIGGSVYTPQAIVNGTDVASYAGNGRAVRGLIEEALGQTPSVEVFLGPVIPGTGDLSVQFEVVGMSEGDELMVVLVERGLSQNVTAGENRGKTLAHENVVRAFDTPAGNFGSAELRLPDDFNVEAGTVVAFVTDTESRRILGATARDVSGSPSAVRGRVVTGSGDPVPETRVLVCGEFLCVPGQSDESGYFTVTDVPAGRYKMRVNTVDSQVVAEISLRSGETLELAQPVVMQ